MVVDIGGTNLRCALVPTDAPTTLLGRSEAQTPATSEAVVDLIARMAEEGVHQLGVPTHNLVGLGCVSPGILDPASGVVSTAVNLGWTDVPLRAMLAERTGLPVAIENDVNAGAIAEYHFSELQRVHAAVQDNPARKPGAHGEVDERVHTLELAEVVLSDGPGVDVVLDGHG
ncbi:MAG: ROK family protein, partial [Bacteroidota bacterium]